MIDEPVPLTSAIELPPFPVDALPGAIADMVHAVAEATQTDPAMPATSALSALSACTGGHAEVEIRSGWREPLCLYTATIAGPGERKSSVQLSMIRPILDVEQQLAEKGAGERLEAETRKQIATKDAERQRNVAVGAEKKDEALADAIGAAMLADAIEVPAIPRLVADDVTPEAAASLLAEQDGRLAIISAEGGIFDIIAGRYSEDPEHGSVAQGPLRRPTEGGPQGPTARVHSPPRTHPRVDDPADGAQSDRRPACSSVAADSSPGSSTRHPCRRWAIARSPLRRSIRSSRRSTRTPSESSLQAWRAGRPIRLC